MKLIMASSFFGMLAFLFAAFPIDRVSQGLPASTPTPFLPVFADEVDSVGNKSLLEGSWPSEITKIFAETVEAANTQRGVTPNMMAAMMMRESWFDASDPNHFMWNRCPNGPVTISCTGLSGEIGPMQVMPYHFEPDEDPYDLKTNLTVAARVLQQAIDAANGDFRLALSAYNKGPYGDFRTNSEGLAYADFILEVLEKRTH